MSAWHKSTYSTGKTSCVEVSEGPQTRIRDTQHRDLGYFEVTAAEWQSFLDAVRARQL